MSFSKEVIYNARKYRKIGRYFRAIALSITIARNLREQTQVAAEPFNSADKSEQLAAMASDLDIQAELATINKEFAVAEMDFKVNLSGVAD